MIKDIVVNLALVRTEDPTSAYAISVAETFGAHITGIVFVYDPVISPGIMDGVSAEWIESQRSESRKMAQEAVDRFEAAANRAGVAMAHRVIESTLGGATDMFGRIARRFDLAVVGQREPNRTVDVVMVATGRAKSDEIPGADVGLHLARHGIKTEVKRIVAEDVDVPNTILSYAADSSTDVIVMGGYGHSRFREWVLGGATRGILSSMTVPALMSH
jgi:nucleotide-binding universal stress UspA family protein